MKNILRRFVSLTPSIVRLGVFCVGGFVGTYSQGDAFSGVREAPAREIAQGVPQETVFDSTTAPVFAASTSAPKKYVLTRLEAICEGAIRDRGDSLSVELENGGAISVSKLDVLWIADSREALFEFKKSRSRLDDANEVLKLADWANRRRLGREGIALLESALAASNDSNERRAFERKLAELRESEKIRVETARTIAERRAVETTASAAFVPEVVATDAELDGWAKQIPFAALERFGRKAQPVLQKRCAASGCHDGSNPTANGYVLNPKARGAETRLALLRNFRETLDFVDLNDPAQSPILKHPTVADENGERVYPFGSDRTSARDRKLFVEWISTINDGKLGRYVHSSSRVRGASSPEERPIGASPLAQNGDSRGASTNPAPPFANLFDSAETVAANGNDDVVRFGSVPEAAQNFRSPDDDPNSPEARLKRVGAIPERTYRDDYDPAIFNARYQTDAAPRRY